MALTVEDGTSVEGADSYISVADAKTYVTNYHGADHAFATATDAAAEVALRRAAQTIDAIYEPILKGYRVDTDQPLAWPRLEVTDPLVQLPLENAEFPAQVLGRAQTEYAIRILAGTDVDPDLGRLTRREKVGDLEVEYIDGAGGGYRIPFVDRLLARYMKAGRGSGSELVRG